MTRSKHVRPLSEHGDRFRRDALGSDDCKTQSTRRWRPRWHCNFGRTASIATKICRQIQSTPAFARTSVRFVRIAPKPNSKTYARTAAAASCHAPFVRRPSGVKVCQWRNDRRRPPECIYRTVWKTSRPIRRGSRISHRKTVDGRGGRSRPNVSHADWASKAIAAIVPIENGPSETLAPTNFAVTHNRCRAFYVIISPESVQGRPP